MADSQPPPGLPDPRVSTVYGASNSLIRDGMLRDVLALGKDNSKALRVVTEQQSQSLDRQVLLGALLLANLVFLGMISIQLLGVVSALQTVREGQATCAGGPLD